MNTSQTRRVFIALLAGIIPFLKLRATPTRKSKTMIIHHVFFWLHQPGNVKDRKQLLEGIQTLATIPGVEVCYAGEPASTEARDVVDHSYDVSELLLFKTLEAQQTYQDHPVHQQFIQKHSHLWKQVKVYDVQAQQFS